MLLSKIKPFIQQNIVEKIELKTAIKMGIAASLSFYIGLHFTKLIERPDPLASGLWCVLASIVVLQAYLGSTYKAVFNRFVGVLIGSISGALFASFIGTWEISLGLAIFSTMILCSLFNLQEGYRIAALSVASVMIPWGVNPEISPWSFAFFRSVDTFMGLIVAVFVAYSIWPNEAVKKVHSNMVHILFLIHQFYQDVLAQKSNDIFEKNSQTLHHLLNGINQVIIDNYVMLEEAKLELFLRPVSLLIWTELLEALERLFYITQALQSVFNQNLESMFDEELKNHMDLIMVEIDHVFQDLELKLQSWCPMPHLPALLDEEIELNKQLTRFRNTHTTRKFNYSEIERYFFFIYNLKSMIKEIKHFDHLLDVFYSETKVHD